MDDRRKHARFNSSVIMQYKNGVFTFSFDTVTKDISLGGVCFFSQKKLRLGQKIEFKLYYDPKIPAKKLKGKVVWCTVFNDKPLKGYLNGLIFIR